MKKYIHTIKSFITTQYYISGAVALVGIFVLYKIFGGGGVKQETFIVTTRDITQKVIASGNTKAVHSVDLGFETNGKVAYAPVDVGTRVSVGDVLVSLSGAELSANVSKAQADVQSSQAKLDELKNGTRPEEITIAETDVTNAQVSLADAQNAMITKIVDGYTKSDDAVHNAIDQLFSNGRGTNPQFNLNVSDSDLKNNLNTTRFQMEALLSDWKNNVNTSSPANVILAGKNLSQVKLFVDSVASAINSQNAASNIPQSTMDGYRAAISTARSNIVTAITNLSSAQQNLNSAQSGLAIAQNTLDLKKSGSTPEAIRAQEADLLQKQAQVEATQAQLAKVTLRSPLTGVVTLQDAHVGEIVTPGKVVVSVISDSDLEIESNVSEINIGKVTVGNPVSITFDAFPGQTFLGTVTYIDPGPTLIDGVVNYKVTITFNQKYPQIKSGLTSGLEIVTAQKRGVLSIPEYFISTAGDSKTVMKKVGGSFVSTPVTVGLRGEDGFVEVTSGLAIGDSIQMPTIAK